jgi:hypothetical protein
MSRDYQLIPFATEPKQIFMINFLQHDKSLVLPFSWALEQQ